MVMIFHLSISTMKILFRTNDYSWCISCGDKEKMCARRCFPCWDEPVYKVPNALSLDYTLDFKFVT